MIRTYQVFWISICLLINSLPHLAQEKWDITVSKSPEKYTLDYTTTEGTWISVDVSPDGQKITFDLLGHIYEMPVAGGVAKALTSGRSWNMFPRYSPEGNKIAFTSDRSGSWDLWTFDFLTDSLVNISKMKLPVVQPSWSKDGTALYGTALNHEAKSEAYRFNFYGSKQKIIETNVFQPVNHFEEHSGRNLIFFEQLDQQLYQSAPARPRGRALPTRSVPPSPWWRFRCSPRGATTM